jgi:hypothetical protein
LPKFGQLQQLLKYWIIVSEKTIGELQGKAQELEEKLSVVTRDFEEKKKLEAFAPTVLMR